MLLLVCSECVLIGYVGRISFSCVYWYCVLIERVDKS